MNVARRKEKYGAAMELWEILVPTRYGTTEKFIRTRHHKEWDKKVRKISGGLTILPVAKGQWLYNHTLVEERVIPVRIACSESQIDAIIKFTLKHYRQEAVMAYRLSSFVKLVSNE